MDKKLNIYLVSQDTNKNYDTYDAMVIAAASEVEAMEMSIEYACETWNWVKFSYIKCELIGADITDQGERVILASYNAG